jgi:enamine deaminase RidA (YjgF/YER057c/UK114 family)
MSSNNFITFKLNYSGSFEEVAKDSLMNDFTLFNVLTIYVPNQKHMYTWIGKRVSQGLKSHIPQIRRAISREYPELQILRNTTIESGLEPTEFLEIIGIEDTTLKANIKELEIKLLPVLSEINRLKSQADKDFILNDYKKAIKIAQKIVSLARAINDDSLEQDQINFIMEANSRAKASKVLQEIETVCKRATMEFDQLIQDEKYKEAHKLVEDIKNKFETKYNLSIIPLAQQLLLKDENMIYRLKIEQEPIIKEIDLFISSFEKTYTKHNLNKMKDFLDSKKDIGQHYLDDKIKFKVKQVNDIYIRTRDDLVNEVSQLSSVALKSMEYGEISKSLEIFEKIVQKIDFDGKYQRGEHK